MEKREEITYREKVEVDGQIVVGMTASLSKESPNNIYVCFYDKALYAKNVKKCREAVGKFVEGIWKEEDKLLGNKKAKK